MKFSVLLLYPDYLAEDYGQDTKWMWIEAEDEFDATNIAQLELAKTESQLEDTALDFHPLLVLHGWHDDVKP